MSLNLGWELGDTARHLCLLSGEEALVWAWQSPRRSWQVVWLGGVIICEIVGGLGSAVTSGNFSRPLRCESSTGGILRFSRRWHVGVAVKLGITWEPALKPLSFSKSPSLAIVVGFPWNRKLWSELKAVANNAWKLFQLVPWSSSEPVDPLELPVVYWAGPGKPELWWKSSPIRFPVGIQSIAMSRLTMLLK